MTETTLVHSSEENPELASSGRITRSMRASGRGLARITYVVIALVIVLAIWQIVVRARHESKLVLPAPTDILQTLVDSRSILFTNLEYTMQAVGIGFGLGAVTGVIVAMFVAEFKLLNRTLYPLIVGFHSMPIIGLAPLFIVWFGFGTEAHSLLAAVLVFWPVFLNMVHGLDVVGGDSAALFRSYGASRAQTMMKLRLPSAMPFLFTGLDLGVIVALLGVIVAEFLGSNDGMGFLLVQNSNNLAISGVFAVMVILAVVGLVLHGAILLIRSAVLSWAVQDR
jgi:NitT/TauT family transport system permease protein